MNIAAILLGIFLTVLGAVWLGWVDVSLKALGLLALITGIVWLVEQIR